MKLLALLFVIAVLMSCHKAPEADAEHPQIIYVTAQAVDNDGQITQFPIISVRP